MKQNIDELKTALERLAILVEKNENPEAKHYNYFMQDPSISLDLISLIEAIEEAALDEVQHFYSAAIFALEVCVAQLQSWIDAGHKSAEKLLHALMNRLAESIDAGKHSLSFWLPILNAFYEVHAELNDNLKEAYFALANEEEDEEASGEEIDYLGSIRDLIEELSDMSVFDITEHFFAQSYAMPIDFFPDLMMDLFSIDEGKEIALLTLMHPKFEVRDILISALDQLSEQIVLSPVSLSRLQTIRNWYPEHYHAIFDRIIKVQRKKGVVFHAESKAVNFEVKASEIDGTGAQGIFIHMKDKRKHRLGGLLFKYGVGIKDAWITPSIPMKEVAQYYNSSFDETVVLREVDADYLQQMINHFLKLSIQNNHIPKLHLLEIQENLNLHCLPELLDSHGLLDELSVQIHPFTEKSLEDSLKRSKSWTKNKRFTESWYQENNHIDKLVNRFCSFERGVKICRFEEAMDAVFEQEMEPHREAWLFHFVWLCLWLKAKPSAKEKLWQDAFFIAYAIQNKMPLKNIPILQEICYQSVVNSVETMQERRTYLSQE